MAPGRQTIHNFVNKLRTTGLLVDEKQKQKHRVLSEEKLDAIGVRKSLKRLAEESGMSKFSARAATQLLKPSRES
jgi:transposase